MLFLIEGEDMNRRRTSLGVRAAVVLLAFLMLCFCTAPALAVSSPSLQSFSGSGIKKKEPPGKLQKTILSRMRAKRSIRLKDVVTEYDSFVDEENRDTDVRDAEIKVVFTPEVYTVKKDGTADFFMQLADVNAFSGKDAAVVVGIPRGSSENAGVKYIEIPAEAENGKVRATFPAWLVKEMRRSISTGWNCVCLVVSREKDETPGGLLFELPPEEDAVTI